MVFVGVEVLVGVTVLVGVNESEGVGVLQNVGKGVFTQYRSMGCGFRRCRPRMHSF